MQWRRHQREALAAIEADGDRNHWVVLPPGAGKTMLGVGAAARWARRTVVFAPNLAVVAQWRDTWHDYTGRDATSDRTLPTDFTALTYQSLATFDADAEGESPIARLHPNGRALVDRLREAGPLTIVLDECHHLLEVWGSLLDDVLTELGENAVVLALTATPPTLLTAGEADLVARLFGDLTYAASIPALVTEGDLVPFTELAWFTTPVASESEWLDQFAIRSEELIAELCSPTIASTSLLTWAALRPFADLDADAADAVIRLGRAGVLPMPVNAHIAERHHRTPDLRDWLALASGWMRALRSGDEVDRAGFERLKGLLPSVGYQFTRYGIKPAQSLVDRVLSRSSSKALAAVEIVAEALQDPNVRVLIITDYATATALPVDLSGVVEPDSGSARWVVAALLRDDRTRDARPIAVTGSMIACSIEDVSSFAGDGRETRDLGDGIVAVEGWDAESWVSAATRALQTGTSRVLVGTRALLGEGWDARSVTCLIDLTSATTSTAIVQTRGRSLRVEPMLPDKVAVNWTVTCVAPERPQGDADYARLVRKHQGWFAPDSAGDVVDGVAHVDDQLSPDLLPETDALSQLNARALARSRDHQAIRDAWRGVDPNRVQAVSTLRIRVRATRRPGQMVALVPETDWRPAARMIVGSAGAVSAGAVVWMPSWAWLVALVAAVVMLPVLTWLGHRARSRLLIEPSIAEYARAVADALQAAGRSPRGAEAVVTEETIDGETRVRLEGVSEPVSAEFTAALAESIGIIEQPRYLMSRPVWDEARWPVLDALRRPNPTREVWHQVPRIFGRRRSDADLFAECWLRHVGAGRLVYAGSEEGEGLLVALRWSSPLGDAAGLIVQRRQW